MLSTRPYTDKETVDSFEFGLKRTFGNVFTFDFAAFYYSYKNLQIPVTTVGSAALCEVMGSLSPMEPG